VITYPAGGGTGLQFGSHDGDGVGVGVPPPVPGVGVGVGVGVGIGVGVGAGVGEGVGAGAATGGGVDFTPLPLSPQAARLASARVLAVMRRVALIFISFFLSI
tara:strand:+ start:5913 stop:6221 length:309 start_codon:yes stop_codon:yes gene_type:complete